MTIVKTYDFRCSNCDFTNKIETEDSITTWLYPELVLKVYNDEYFFVCSNCKHKNRISNDILINTRKGMFYLDTTISKEEKRTLLIKYGVVDKDGNILKQERIPSEEVQHESSIAPLVKGLEKVVEDFRDELLNQEEENEIKETKK